MIMLARKCGFEPRCAAAMIAASVCLTCPAQAQQAKQAQQAARVPVPAEGAAAMDRGDWPKAAGIVLPAFDACRAANPQGAVCTDLAIASGMLVAIAGNAKVEPILLDALAYVDARVGAQSQEAFSLVAALASYYDRLFEVQKAVPVTLRRLTLARKLYGPLAPAAVTAAISVCVVQWNMEQGQAAIELTKPLADQLPRRTAEERMLAGHVENCLGSAYFSQDRNAEAEQHYRAAIALFEAAAGESGDEGLGATASLADTLRRLGREGEARALAARIDRLAKPGAEVRKRIEWAKAPSGDPIAVAKQELADAEQKFGPKSPVTDMAASGLGLALIDAGRVDEAAPYLDRIAAAAASEATPASFRIKLLTGQIALLAKGERGFLKALPVMEQLIALAKRTDAGSNKLLMDFQMYAGATLTGIGHPARGYPYLSDAGRLLLERIASYRAFDDEAQRETREYSPIFRFKVAAAWALARSQ